MEITFNLSGDMSITPNPGRKVIDHFVDYETGYIVIRESNEADNPDRLVYFTLFDQKTGDILDVNKRAAHLDQSEHITFDETKRLKITSQRTIDTVTGMECVIEKVIDAKTGKELLSRGPIAFSRVPRQPILEKYYESQANAAKRKAFWTEEYPKMSLEDRKGFWVSYFYRDMRIMGEIGEDQLTIFSPETYREYKQLDPEFDLILDYLAEVLPIAFGMEEEIQQKIRAMRSQA